MQGSNTACRPCICGSKAAWRRKRPNGRLCSQLEDRTC